MLSFLHVITMISSCSHNVLNDNDIIIDLDNITDESIPLSLYVDSISYLDLEDSEEAMIGIANRICFFDSLIVIQGANRNSCIALFNRQGQFIRRISHRGQGPEEYLRATSIDVDSGGIYLFDNLSASILKFDFSGVLLDKYNVGYDDDFAVVSIDNSPRFLFANYNDFDKRAGIFLTTDSPSDRKRIVSCRDKGVMIDHLFEFYHNGHNISSMTREFEHKVLNWENDSMICEYNLIVSPAPTDRQIRNISHNDILEHYICTAFYNTDRWLILNFWRNEDGCRVVVIDKQNNNVRIGKDLHNDIDGNKFYTTSTAVDNAIIQQYDPGNDRNTQIVFLHLK